MTSIWVTEIVLRPTGAMSFRKMPSGILHIMSYPFIPPTTMSGFICRLMHIAKDGDWPGYGHDWYNGPRSKEFTLTLDCRYRSLGAFPHRDRWVIHKTRRHGPKNFKHDQFSHLLRTDHKENYELHHWDYLFCDRLTGWVAAREKEPLEMLTKLKNYGGKAGKEGYVIVDQISDPIELHLNHGTYTPLGLLTPPDRPLSGEFYQVYGHHWDKNYEWLNGEKGGVVGYTQFGAWWNVDSVTGPFWEFEPGMGFPVSALDAFLTGDVEPFCNKGNMP